MTSERAEKDVVPFSLKVPPFTSKVPEVVFVESFSV